MKRYFRSLILLAIPLLLSSCASQNSSSITSSSTSSNPVTMKELSKSDYHRKTLGGLLGQFTGFLSGYEFVQEGPDPKIGMSESWFSFLNGPYAGNYTNYYPGSYATGNNKYNRLRVDDVTGKTEVYSDDDYHIDIFNQHILKEFGDSSYDIKEAWKKYNVGDWGGGSDAMSLTTKHEALSPFTGTIEGGNRYGWCTEAYIENETLGMNTPGMGPSSVALVDKFASVSGYFDSVCWARFYGYMYSMAYFCDDVVSLMEMAKPLLVENSHPRDFYDYAVAAYKANPSDYHAAAEEIVSHFLPVHGEDNIMTNPNVNGAFAILSWLYGNNDYMETCKYSSIMGYDGDCTAAICTGLLGIIKGFDSTSEGYKDINDKIYHDGEGVYVNDTETGYPPCIKGDGYPAREKIEDIVDLYQGNFEKILLKNGGSINGDVYQIPYQEYNASESYLFTNYDAEERDTSGFSASNGEITILEESDGNHINSGYACFLYTPNSSGEVYHHYSSLKIGESYHLTVYVSSKTGSEGELYAKSSSKRSAISFVAPQSLIAKNLYFVADSNEMDIGLSLNGGSVYFDDFLLERIPDATLDVVQEESFGGKVSKNAFTLSKDSSGSQEVLLRIPYRFTGSSSYVTLKRNSEVFGGFPLSKTGSNLLTGGDYVLVPYVFEESTDTLIIDMNGANASFGEITIIPMFVALNR